MSRRAPLWLALSVALVAGACGGGDDATSSTMTIAPADETISSTTVAPLTTTTMAARPVPAAGGPIEPIPFPPGARAVVAGEPNYTGVLGNIAADRWVVAPAAPDPLAIDGAAPLTGLPADDPSALDRPAIVAKIDNGPSARPQSGLVSADIVFEERVEGGSTRFAAVFHSQSTSVGPVRSARSTDIAIVGSLGRPAFVWSGANKVFAPLIKEQDIVDAGLSALPAAFERASDRRAPSNLMTDTDTIWAAVEGSRPAPHFDYRRDGVEVIGGSPVESFSITFPQNDVAYSWDGDGWARRQGGTAHVVADGTPIRPANVVVQEVEHVGTGLVDPAGALVTEDVAVGSGRAWVFTAGQVVEGIWTRPTIRSITTFTRPDGSIIELTPGRTWVEYVDEGELSY